VVNHACCWLCLCVTVCDLKTVRCVDCALCAAWCSVCARLCLLFAGGLQKTHAPARRCRKLGRHAETAGGVLSVGVSSPLGALRAAAQVGRSD
jgi:hypothetical protein